jgi:hypothetical protein
LLFALFSMMGGGGSNSATSAAAATATAVAQATAANSISGTMSIEATRTAMAHSTDFWAGAGVVVGADYKQKLPPVYPETLEVDGVPFRVYPSAIGSAIGSRWEYEALEGTASWIAGTVINWSFGVPALDQNKALIKRLEQGGDGEKVALVRMSGGVVRHFRLQRPTQIEQQQIEVFLQDRPGITLVLLGDEQGPRRWLVRGVEDYSRSGYGAGLGSDFGESPAVTPAVQATPTLAAQPTPVRSQP